MRNGSGQLSLLLVRQRKRDSEQDGVLASGESLLQRRYREFWHGYGSHPSTPDECKLTYALARAAASI